MCAVAVKRGQSKLTPYQQAHKRKLVVVEPPKSQLSVAVAEMIRPQPAVPDKVLQLVANNGLLVGGGGGGGGGRRKGEYVMRWNHKLGGGNALYNLLANAYILTPIGRKFVPDPNYKGDGEVPPQKEPLATTFDPSLPYDRAVEKAKARAIRKHSRSMGSRGKSGHLRIVYRDGVPVDMQEVVPETVQPSTPVEWYDTPQAHGFPDYVAMHKVMDEMEAESKRLRLYTLQSFTPAQLFHARYRRLEQEWEGDLPQESQPILDKERLEASLADLPPWDDPVTVDQQRTYESDISSSLKDGWNGVEYEDTRLHNLVQEVAEELHFERKVQVSPDCLVTFDHRDSSKIWLNFQIDDKLWYRVVMSDDQFYSSLDHASSAFLNDHHVSFDRDGDKVSFDKRAWKAVFGLHHLMSGACVGEDDNQFLLASVTDLRKVSDWIEASRLAAKARDEEVYGSIINVNARRPVGLGYTPVPVWSSRSTRPPVYTKKYKVMASGALEKVSKVIDWALDNSKYPADLAYQAADREHVPHYLVPALIAKCRSNLVSRRIMGAVDEAVERNMNEHYSACDAEDYHTLWELHEEEGGEAAYHKWLADRSYTSYEREDMSLQLLAERNQLKVDLFFSSFEPMDIKVSIGQRVKGWAGGVLKGMRQWLDTEVEIPIPGEGIREKFQKKAEAKATAELYGPLTEEEIAIVGSLTASVDDSISAVVQKITQRVVKTGTAHEPGEVVDPRVSYLDQAIINKVSLIPPNMWKEGPSGLVVPDVSYEAVRRISAL